MHRKWARLRVSRVFSRSLWGFKLLLISEFLWDFRALRSNKYRLGTTWGSVKILQARDFQQNGFKMVLGAPGRCHCKPKMFWDYSESFSHISVPFSERKNFGGTEFWMSSAFAIFEDYTPNRREKMAAEHKTFFFWTSKIYYNSALSQQRYKIRKNFFQKVSKSNFICGAPKMSTAESLLSFCRGLWWFKLRLRSDFF